MMNPMLHLFFSPSAMNAEAAFSCHTVLALALLLQGLVVVAIIFAMIMALVIVRVIRKDWRLSRRYASAA